MIRLTKKQLLLLHEELITATGGAAGIRDEGLLGSALAAPFQSFEGHIPYPSLQQKAARLGYGLVLWMAISVSLPMPCWCFWP